MQGETHICGLVGVCGDVTGNKRKVFEELLIVDKFRGPHSTGVGAVNRFKDGEMLLTKGVGPPEDLLASKEYKDMMHSKTFKALVGHNRYATVGKINDENAHPFLFNNVLGAHNGFIEWGCRQKLFEQERFDTDSEAVFSNIDEFGLEDTFKLIAQPYFNRNAYSLVFYDKEFDTINFIRNEERPLYYMYSKDECTLFWASEPGMLRWILERNNVPMYGTDEDRGTVFQVTSNHHYSWKIPKSTSTPIGRPTMHKMEVPAYQSPHVSTFHTTSSYGNVSDFPVKQHNLPFNVGGNNLSVKKRIEKIDTKKWHHPYKDFNGKVMKKPQVLARITDGCAFCTPQKAAEFAENFAFGKFVFFLKPDVNNNHLFLCEDCYNDDDILGVCEELM